jgi:hypothetical protein
MRREHIERDRVDSLELLGLIGRDASDGNRRSVGPRDGQAVAVGVRWGRQKKSEV